MTDSATKHFLRTPSMRRDLLLYLIGIALFHFMAEIAIAWSNIGSTTSEQNIAIQTYLQSSLESDAKSALLRGNAEDLKKLLTTLIKRPEVAEISVVDATGKLFAQAGKTNAHNVNRSFELELTQIPKIAASSVFNRDELVNGAPIHIGKLEYTIDETLLQLPSKRVFFLDVILCLITTVIFAFVLKLTYRKAMAPITTLVDHIQGIDPDNAGNEEVLDTHVAFGDELSRVWDAHRAVVAKNLRQAREIATQNQSLAAHAQERDHQTMVANEALYRLENVIAEQDAFVSNVMDLMKLKSDGLTSAMEFLTAYIDALRSIAETSRYTGRNFDPDTQTEAFAAILSKLQQLDSTYAVASLCAEELHAIINNLLTSTLNRYADLSLESQPTDILSSLRQLIDSKEDDAKRKHIAYRSQFLIDNSLTNPLLLIDWKAVALVVRTLLTNAIAFTRENGSVNVVCELMSGIDQVNVRITVDDSGIGMDLLTQKRLKALFGQQAQGDHAQAPNLDTLSLELAQRIARQLNATLTLLRSEPGRGSSFCFVFSATPISDADRLLGSNAQKRYGMDVLYLNNDPAIEQTLFKETCKRIGHFATCVSSADAAVALLEDRKWDCLFVSDQFSNGQSGLAMIAALRKRMVRSPYASMPIIHVFKKHQDDLEDLVAAAGGNGQFYQFDKPTVLKALLKALS